MKAGGSDMGQVLIGLGDVAADQRPQLVHGQPQFLGSFVLGVLCLGRFGGGYRVVHDPNRILRAEYRLPNQAENLDETLVHLTDLSTSEKPLSYSSRSITRGSIRVAALAGSAQATITAPSKTSAAMTKVRTSVGLTP